MKQWIFEHIIMKIFYKELSYWFHNEVYLPLTRPLPENWMDEMTDEDWERSRKFDEELFSRL